MRALGIACWIAVALLPVGARAGETPYGSQQPSVRYYACTAPPMTNTMPTYVSSAFQDTGQLGQQRLNVEFKKYLMQKYGYPETSGGVMCFPDTTESGARARQHDRVQYTKNVVDTGWKPAG